MQTAPRAILGPGRCEGCGRPVEYRRIRISGDGRMRGPAKWRNPATGRAHWCGDSFRERTGFCGAILPRLGERCERRPGHRTEHRSRYAMDNASLAHVRRYGREATL